MHLVFLWRFVCMSDDEVILEFTLKSLEAPDPFAVSLELEKDVVQALAWQGARAPWDLMQQRENIIERIEACLSFSSQHSL